jgi:hypothetical protein
MTKPTRNKSGTTPGGRPYKVTTGLNSRIEVKDGKDTYTKRQVGKVVPGGQRIVNEKTKSSPIDPPIPHGRMKINSTVRPVSKGPTKPVKK